MIQCEGDRIYTGIAIDVASRFAKHRSGRGAAFMRMHKPLRLMAARKCGSRSKALREEYALKQLPRAQKLAWAKQWRYAAASTSASSVAQSSSRRARSNISAASR